MNYSAIMNYLTTSALLYKLISIILMLIYTMTPVVLISVIQINAGKKNALTTAANKTAKALILFCINRALSLFFGGVIFLFVELVLILIIIFIVSRFYITVNLFDRKLNFYIYGIKQFFTSKELKDDR